ncbi:glycosyltransferase family 4 protein [Anthocerotibacter panamensis]|uniref:glycosyltransferase family 4 protein n=1 Tax=Anthocerotibacter panamensis TaxID=2857077 RepID=UPI001C404D38|nr:glycosyltransferase family 1 protein [Anthocerotibacter panamensis]
MKILLVGNYVPDAQQSMQRFAEMLAQGLSALGHEIRVLKPEPILGRIKVAGASKWLGYGDKFFFFPHALRAHLAWADVVHICDHSNAFYTAHLQAKPHLVTCHDLLAVRGALGEDTDCPASRTGKILQRWILKGLQRARMVVCDSTYTLGDLTRLTGKTVPAQARPVLLGLNHRYRPLSPTEIRQRLDGLWPASEPFILHVGSSLCRKNRDGVLRIFQRIKDLWPGKLVFVGEPLTPELLALVKSLDLQERVSELGTPDNQVLEALYNQAFALLFPSRFEGFGWPIIEAQACGCPVLVSTRCSLPEVAGGAALMRAIEDEAGFAEDLLRLTVPEERARWIERGRINLERFTPERMLADYSEIYLELGASR